MPAEPLSPFPLALIVAVAQNGAIGKDNGLLWQLPADLRHFKTLTMGRPMVMGRKTYQSIGRPLPGRTSIVVSGNAGFAAPGCVVVSSLAQALAEAARLAPSETFVIGGADIYRQTLPLASRIYLTQVHANFDGDTFWPEPNPSEWRETSREDFAPDDRHTWPYSFVTLDRVAN